jgi:MYXO-CTERM domain-containing protein
VDRNELLWPLVVFFGATLLFAAIHDATKDEGTAVSLGAQALVGLALVGAIVVIVRRRR